MSARQRQILVVRSLTESDLGLFSAHRANEKSRQRAININADVVARMLSPELISSGQATLQAQFVFGELNFLDTRRIKKTGKNWRLGGDQIAGNDFGKLDAKDFMLLRIFEESDGTGGVGLSFISRRIQATIHAGVASILERKLKSSMAVFSEATHEFEALAVFCPEPKLEDTQQPDLRVQRPKSEEDSDIPSIPRQPESLTTKRRPTVIDKVRSPWLMERMFQLAGDLSGPAQLSFIQTIEALASQLRVVLLNSGRIVQLDVGHKNFWPKMQGLPIGFIDGGLANLSMVGSAPLAARVGAYVVIPGTRGPEREQFRMVKELIDDLFEHPAGGIFQGIFPDYGALRDAARISIEAAGGVQLLQERSDLHTLMLHGALVNPVSRYSDLMADKKVAHPFPAFSDKALDLLLPTGDPARNGADKNFISVHLRQLEILQESQAAVCGVVEREGTSCTVVMTLLEQLDDEDISDSLPIPAHEWKAWFRSAVKPDGDSEMEGQRISDSLLFRCLLNEGEALLPVSVNRNDLRRAPEAWKDTIARYPKPQVSFVQVSEWSAPVRVEIFEKDLDRFTEIAGLVLHASKLLPRYAFPAGLDIVDKFAHIPDWMSHQANTRATVKALSAALQDGDFASFDTIRRILCGSNREWLLRPGIFK